MELIDLYDEHRNFINKQIEREKVVSGKFGYYLIVNVIIINNNNEILISRRSSTKKTHALMWECAGGAVSAGENSINAATREISEELGISLDINKGKLLLEIKEEEKFRFRDVYVFYQDIDIKDVKFADGEACDAKYVTIDEFKKMYINNEIVKSHKFVIDNYSRIINERK